MHISLQFREYLEANGWDTTQMGLGEGESTYSTKDKEDSLPDTEKVVV